jgi:hypothetical protein
MEERHTVDEWRLRSLAIELVIEDLASAPPVQKAKGADPNRARQRRRLTERDHPGTAGEIISERRATSNRNAGRDHRGFASDFPRNPHSHGYFRRSDELAGNRGLERLS